MTQLSISELIWKMTLLGNELPAVYREMAWKWGYDAATEAFGARKVGKLNKRPKFLARA